MRHLHQGRAREGYSLPAQEERLRSHAKSQGWAVYKLYMEDGYSAGNRDRPALKPLLFEASLKGFEVVLVYEIDRLSRILKDLIDIMAELNQFDIGFKSRTELIDTTRPEGRLMFHQFGSFAQYERERIPFHRAPLSDLIPRRLSSRLMATTPMFFFMYQSKILRTNSASAGSMTSFLSTMR